MSSADPRQIVLDDTDPSITYRNGGNGQWAVSTGAAETDFGIFGLVYNDTLHQVTNTPGSSFQFQFVGEWG